MCAEYPAIESADQLYHHYKVMYTDDITDLLCKDVPRSGFGKNRDFDTDPRSLKNPLFNVLNAFAHFDTEVGYSQGMNMIAA